ncbi:recombinase family protein [Dyadobacter sediminis]|uniref:Recombinase family protein n=1 Tax=Dyadobacter sediminis TaxID=1493691 RepID=A0A5R9KQ41_9BACT|nr:recombinase family protein [Dyadobacter sediminis]TLU98352.1 recombinase family protein [Dyadobacter sediminis]GGC14668.1 resolvase [Dyadobacter sediminis]
MKIGYARVSTQDQNLEMQLDALGKAGCEKVFQEKASGIKSDRPQLAAMQQILREGDVIFIYKLDRLGRSLKHLLEMTADLAKRGIGLVSINDSIDTTTAQGRLIFNIFASLAEFERDLIRERTKSGLEAARARGRKGGRSRGLSKEAEKKAMLAQTLYNERKLGVNEIAADLEISKMTLYKYLRHRGVLINEKQGK